MTSVAPQPGVVRTTPEEKAANAKDEAAARRRIRAYYEKKYDSEVDRLRALRLSTRRRKRGLIAAGSLLLAICLATALASHLGHIAVRNLESYEMVVGGLAMAALLIAMLMKPVEALPDTKQVEHEVDEAKYRDINALVSKTGKLIKGPSDDPETFDLRLEGYPDKSDIEGRGYLVAGRIGLDGLPRFTPVKVTALRLYDHNLAIYQVTVDLINGAMISERLLELAYRDIVTLERSSLTLPVSSEAEPEKRLGPLKRRKSRLPLRDKDTLAIHFASQQSINVVLRDTAFAELAKGGNLPLSSTHESVERFWYELRTKWLAATGRPHPDRTAAI